MRESRDWVLVLWINSCELWSLLLICCFIPGKIFLLSLILYSFSYSSASSDYAEYSSQHFSRCEWLVLSPLQTWSWLLCQKSSLTHRNLSHSESSSRPVLESMQRDACLERHSPGAWHPCLGSLLQGQGQCTWVLSLSHREFHPC